MKREERHTDIRSIPVLLARRRRRLLLLLVLVVIALGLRVGYMQTLEERHYWPDETYYAHRATEIREGSFAQQSAFDAPGYPYFVAFTHMLGGLWLARTLQILLGAATCVLIAAIGESAFGFRAGAIAGAIYAVYPFAVYLPSVLYPQTLLAFLLALAFLLLVRYRETGRPAALLSASVLLGCSILVVPPVMILCPLLALWVVWKPRQTMGLRLGTILLMAAFVLLAILPWTMRNIVVLDRFVFLTEGSSQLFYMQNNPHVDPNDRDVGRIHRLTLTEDLREEIRKEGTGREAANRVYKRRAYAFIRDNPGTFAVNCLKRLANYFALKPRLYSRGEHTGSLYLIVSSLSWGPVLLFAVAGTVLAARKRRQYIVMALIPVCLGVLYCFFHGSVRYRLPTDPFAILLASYFLSYVLGRLRPSWADSAGGSVEPA